MEGPIDLMSGPIDFESREFQARCQIRRIAYLTGVSHSDAICAAIDSYYQRILTAATDEQLQTEEKCWRSLGGSSASAASYASGSLRTK